MKLQRKYRFDFDQDLIERIRLRFLEEFKRNRSFYDENDARSVALDDYWIERFLNAHQGKFRSLLTSKVFKLVPFVLIRLCTCVEQLTKRRVIII